MKDQKIKAILIDDEPFCTAGLEIDLKEHCPQIEIIAICNSSKEGLKQIKQLKPDVVFLDIEMPWMNGFEMLELLSPITFEVIFITAYNDFAVQAFRLNAIDYLMKPVESDLLIEAVNRIQVKESNPLEQQENIASLLKNIKKVNTATPKISVPSSNGIDLIPVADIIYCKAESYYTNIYLADGNKKLICRVLKEVEKQLSAFNYCRIHQSYLINMNHLVSYHRSDGGMVEMVNGDKIAVSRTRKQELLNKLKA